MRNRVVLKAGLVCGAVAIVLSSAVFATAYFAMSTVDTDPTQTPVTQAEANELCKQYFGSDCIRLNKKLESAYLSEEDGMLGSSWHTITYQMNKDEQSRFMMKYSFENGANRGAEEMRWKSNDAIIEAERISDELMKLSIYWD